MSEIMPNRPESFRILEQAVTGVIKSVAIEETALSNLLILENEIIQKAKTDAINLDEFVAINESVNAIIKNITKVQMLTQIKLHFVAELLQKMENFHANMPLGPSL